MRRIIPFVLAAALAAPAHAAPKIDNVAVKPNPAQFAGGKAPEVQVSISVNRSRFDSGTCDVRVQFGDGAATTIDFGAMSGTRTVHHAYAKGGSFKVVVQGAGKTPCDGSRELALNVTGEPAKKGAEKKAPPAKKDEKKKAEKKKAEPKKAAKKSDKKADAKKKSEKKKAEDK